MSKKTLFIWACDYSENTGEGKLARIFVENLNFKKKYNLKFNQKKTLSFRYISTIFGILFCWQKYLNKKKVCYLNYLPLWNFLIFILLPPKTILGPITGGANFSKSNILNYHLRKNIFPIFYKISEFFLYRRSSNIIFSTDLLKKYLSKKTIKKGKFNFILKNFKLQKKVAKKIDFLIYYRKHKNKKTFFPINFIRKLSLREFSISIIGDKLNIPKVKNYGNISNKKVSKLQSISKYTIASGENLYSFFIIECLSNNVQVLLDSNYKKKIVFFKKQFIKINYGSLNNFKKLRKIR